MTGPILEGELVRLRPYRPDDVEALQRTANDPRVSRFMNAGFPSPYTRADAEWWLTKIAGEEPAHHFVIESRGAFAGAIGVLPHEGERAGSALFGYWLGVAFWGRGIATDAARTLARHAFGTMRLRRLEASVFVENAPSARVLEKAGFRLEGRLREAYVDRQGGLQDALLYARLAHDPEPR